MRTSKQSETSAMQGFTPRSGRIVIGTDGPEFCITLQKISPDSARIRQVFPFPLPGTFSLITYNTLTERHEERSCETVWQRGDLVHARFL